MSENTTRYFFYDKAVWAIEWHWPDIVTQDDLMLLIKATQLFPEEDAIRYIDRLVLSKITTYAEKENVMASYHEHKEFEKIVRGAIDYKAKRPS